MLFMNFSGTEERYSIEFYPLSLILLFPSKQAWAILYVHTHTLLPSLLCFLYLGTSNPHNLNFKANADL